MRAVLGLALVTAALAGAPQADAGRVPLPGVVTPSGNIRCFYVPAKPAHLLCDVRRALYAQREQARCMARAGLDWHGWELYATRVATTVCSGGILYNSSRNVPRYRTLAYGSTWRFAAFTCTSRIAGLTCTTGTGHGIFLSRESWRGW
ncbi:MAG TPA: DUF6636 domain-containing protein [Gaiellaceae bacterium]|nr:DUF6636 domain-containing protein [Gaiellaceae bacterium]